MSSRLIAAVVLLAALWYGSTAYTAHRQAQAAAAQAAADRVAYEAAARNAIAAMKTALVAIENYKTPPNAANLIPFDMPEITACSSAMDQVRMVYATANQPPSFSYLVLARADLWVVWERTWNHDDTMLRPARMRVDCNLGIAEDAIKAGK